MVKTYLTKAGQMWDEVAFEIFGDCKYTADLMKANPDLLCWFIFPAGIELKLPEIEKPTAKNNLLPAWFSN